MQVRRLKTKAQFQALLACPPVARTEHFVMHRLDLSETGQPQQVHTEHPLFGGALLWQGAMVPKRWSRRAVTRNLIKRQIYSLPEGSLDLPAAYLVRQRASFDRLQYKSASSQALRGVVRAEIAKLVQKATRTQPKEAV
jgi:ribonuclease P protein component